MMAIPSPMLNFVFKDAFRSFFSQFMSTGSNGVNFAVNVIQGGVAGAVSLSIVQPLQVSLTKY